MWNICTSLVPAKKSIFLGPLSTGVPINAATSLISEVVDVSLLTVQEGQSVFLVSLVPAVSDGGPSNLQHEPEWPFRKAGRSPIGRRMFLKRVLEVFACLQSVLKW